MGPQGGPAPRHCNRGIFALEEMHPRIDPRVFVTLQGFIYLMAKISGISGRLQRAHTQTASADQYAVLNI